MFDASSGVRRPCHLALALLIGGLAFLPVTASIEDDPSKGKILPWAAAAGQKQGLMRIGLADDHRVEVSSRGEFSILRADNGQPAWRDRFDVPIQVVAEGGPVGEVPRIYRVQAGAFADRTNAEAERDRLVKKFGVGGIVHLDPDRNNFRVRLGEATRRNDLDGLVAKMRDAGMASVWIAEELAEAVEGVRIRLVDPSYDTWQSPTSRLFVIPRSRRPIRIGETEYRGIVELRVSPVGTVRPVNWIELEQYLRGVVPAELGPEVWPEIEALKAQAVAARTYAWKHRGQFEEEGFDLCATPRCQVYKGEDAEHPLSDRAIQGTRRQILSWEDEPIDAYFTATCGGHTENGGDIFPGEYRPYLQGVPCRPEESESVALRARLRGAPIVPLLDETGLDVTRDWALLYSVGIVPEKLVPKDRSRQLDAKGLRRWTAGLARRAGLPVPAGNPGSTVTLGEAAESLVRDVGWDRRGQVLLAEADLAAILRQADVDDLPLGQRRALAALSLDGGLYSGPSGALDARTPPSRLRLLPVISAVGAAYEAFGLKSGTFTRMENGRLRLVRGKGSSRLAVADDALLFGRASDRAVPARSLELWPGDRLRYSINSAGKIAFLELIPPVNGVSDDRSSRVYSWEFRKTRRQLEASMNRRLSVGTLKDLRIVRRGVSGRVVELEVVGSKGSSVVKGFDIRGLFGRGLRDLLFTLEIQRDAGGKMNAVVLRGKAWGHGVGLCQVGAYGMALRGQTYEEILGHYYRGAKLTRLESP